MVADMGGAILKPMMEELGFLEQFKNGLVHSLKLPRITEILHNKFLV